jgi:curved DNA-binding protein CbpA
VLGRVFLAIPSKVENALMKSLYELIGASADDDAEALKKAFRKAVKAHHPDLHPDDPDAQTRFREIITAHALLRDPRQRADYDRLLRRERFQLTLVPKQLGPKLARQQLPSKRMRATAVIAAVGALIGGYGLWATLATTDKVEIDRDELAAAAGGAVEKHATVVATAKDNENPAAAIGAKADAVNGDKADEPGESVGAVRKQPEPSPTASETKSGATADIAERELALGPLSNNANVYKARGIASYRSGDFPQAIASFNAAILLDPDDAQAYDIRGNAWDEVGGFESALADYDEAIRLDPNDPAIFHDRGIMWQHKGELDKALLDLDRAIRFSFSDARMYCDRGPIWYESGLDSVIEIGNRPITELDPNSAAACITRGLILHRNSEFKLAPDSVNQAIRVDPNIFDAFRRANLRP